MKSSNYLRLTRRMWRVIVLGAVLILMSNFIMAAVTLTQPAANVSNVSITPTFKWTTGTSGPYILRVFKSDNTGNAIGNAVVDIGNINTKTLTPTVTLEYSTKYVWYVNAGGTWYPSSSIGQIFTTIAPPPDNPTLLQPANNAFGVSVEPTLTWKFVSGCTYTVELYKDPEFTDYIGSSTGLTSGSQKIPIPLENSTQYYWRVCATNSTGTSGYSSRTFTTISALVPILSNPIGGVTINTLTPTLGWYLEQSATGISFDVQWSTDNTFQTGTKTVSTSQMSKIVSPALSYGTTYYWRVKSKNSSGAIISCSTPESFVTYGAAVAPIPSYPVGGEQVYTNTPTLYWYSLEYITGQKYQVQYRPEGGAWKTLPSGSTYTSALNLTLPSLEPGTNYEWRVRSYNGVTNSPWSEIQTFISNGSSSTELPVPEITYPSDNAVIYTTSPTLYWSLSEYVAGLKYEIDIWPGIEDHSHPVGGAYITSNTLFKKVHYLASGDGGTALVPGKYTFYVRSTKGTSTSEWSDPVTFTIYGSGADLKPILSNPANNETIYTTSPMLSWYVNGTGATSYNLYVKKPDGTNYFHPTPLVVANTNFTLEDLDPGTYSWRVSSNIPGGGTSTPSAWWKFTVASSMGSLVPIISQPDGGVTTSTRPELSWYLNGASTVPVTFEVQYSNYTNFSGKKTISNITTTHVIIPQTGTLAAGAPYFWRVRTYSHGVTDPSEWSNIGMFNTSPSGSASIPIVGSPVDGININTVNPTLSWFTFAGNSQNLTYDLQYSTDTLFSNAIEIKDIKVNQADLSDLSSGATYYWRVRSKTADGQMSEYSEPGEFVPTSTTAVEGKDNNGKIPTEFSLNQNYPNPFNPTTVISFGLPKDAFVTLKIYNILGQEVRTLINNMKQAGSYNVQWNGKDNSGNMVQSGTYIYRIIAGDNVSAKKMILIK